MKTTILITSALLFLAFYIPYWRYQRFLTRFRTGLKMGSNVKILIGKKPVLGTVNRIYQGGMFRVKSRAESGRYFNYYTIRRGDIFPMIGGHGK